MGQCWVNLLKVGERYMVMKCGICQHRKMPSARTTPIPANAEPSSTLHVGDDCALYVGIASPICREGVETVREVPKRRMCAGQPDTNTYGKDTVQTTNNITEAAINTGLV